MMTACLSGLLRSVNAWSPALAVNSLVSVRHLNANRAVVTKIKRPVFARLHPVTTVLPDGSTITVKYKEPKNLIRFPLDLETATAEQKRIVAQMRRPKTKLNTIEDKGKAFDPMKYVKY